MNENNFVVQTALMSVTDKTGLAEFAKGLVELGTKTILSTGGTAKALLASGIQVTEVADYTGFPEMMDGRVKTLHPKIYGGLLWRDVPEDIAMMEKYGILPIDLLCVNLYQFEQTVESGASHDANIENIDIGGPCLIRAAAKNCEKVIVVTNPGQYAWVIESLREHGDVSRNNRNQLQWAAFSRTKQYDSAIYEYLDIGLMERVGSLSG